jgi:hypothetical protein
MLKARFLCSLSLVFASTALQSRAQFVAKNPGDDAATVQADTQRLLRKISFGNRELALPLQLKNDELSVQNDKLEIAASKLQGVAPDTERMTIDQFALEQSKVAVNLATVFSQVWSASGETNIQKQLAESDAKFDEAVERCRQRDKTSQVVAFANIDEAKTACSDLETIRLTVARIHVATPNGWRSVFKDDPDYRRRVGYRLVTADANQLRRDQASHVDLRIKKTLILQDEILIGTDKQIWLEEIIDQATAEFNAKHPDHLMATGEDLLAMTMKLRQSLADAGIDFRNSIAGGSQTR